MVDKSYEAPASQFGRPAGPEPDPYFRSAKNPLLDNFHSRFISPSRQVIQPGEPM